MHSHTQTHPSVFGFNWNPVDIAIAGLLTMFALIFVFLFLMITAD